MKKTIVLIMLIASAVFAAELVRVEKLTANEKQILFEAEKAVRDAQQKLEEVKKEIREAHKMYDGDYVWWGLKTEISGDYILQRRWGSY